MASALDPNRIAVMRVRLDRALAARRASRPSNSDRSVRGAKARRHDLSRDPFFKQIGI